VSRTHGPTGWQYRTHEDEELHDRLWGWVHGRDAWDIGANDGQSVDALVERGFESIVALEPAGESFRILKQEWGSHPGITLLNKAAGAEKGKLALSVRNTPIHGGQLVSPDLPEAGWHGNELYRRQVECVTLDDLQQEYGTPDMIKIDTEGFEEQILRGGPEVLQCLPDMLIEYHSRDLLSACSGYLRGYWRVRVIENEDSPGNGWILAEGAAREEPVAV
jgi:FkbM family methyltransferase